MLKVLIILIIGIIVLISIPIFLGYLFSVPGYKGPVSDHFDGKKFSNPGNVEAKGLKDLIKWARNREPGIWKEITEITTAIPPVKFADDEIRVTFINHSSFLIQSYGLTFLTDPIWSERASPVSFAGPKRMVPPGIKMEDLPKIDIILLTHNHYDHLDIKALKELSKQHNPKIYCPLGVGRYLKKKGIDNIQEMDWWDRIPIKDDLTLMCTPAQHFSGRGMFDRDKTLWCGFALMKPDGSIYYSGDTGYGDFFKDIAEKISPIKLSFLPIGAYKPGWFMAPIHTSPADAVRIHKEMGSQLSIPMHFGTFPLADDGMDDPVNDLKIAMKTEGISETEFIVLQNGQSWQRN